MYEKRLGQYVSKHPCLSCEKIITYRFAICANCEEIHGRSALGWPEWLRFTWNDEQRHRRREIKDAKNEVLFTDLYPPIEEQQMWYDHENQILDSHLILTFFEKQPEEVQLIAGLKSMGYPHAFVAGVVKKSRTSVGTILTEVKNTLIERGLF